MTIEAKPSRRGKPDNAPPKELEIPKDALLTRGFVRRLPGYIEGQRIERGQFSDKPNWRGETKHDGRSVVIEIKENSDSALNITIVTPDRKDTYRTEIRHNYSANRSYVSYELRTSEIHIFPLVSETGLWKPEYFNRKQMSFLREQKLYFIDNDYHGGNVSNEQIFREKEVGDAPIPEHNVFPLSERIGKDNMIFKSFQALKALMLKAKSTTPPVEGW